MSNPETLALGKGAEVLEDEIMSGCTLSGRWVMALWVVILLSLGASAATHTQTVALKVEGMV